MRGISGAEQLWVNNGRTIPLGQGRVERKNRYVGATGRGGKSLGHRVF